MCPDLRVRHPKALSRTRGDHAQAPPEVVGQRVLAARGVPNFVAEARDVVHHPHYTN